MNKMDGVFDVFLIWNISADKWLQYMYAKAKDSIHDTALCLKLPQHTGSVILQVNTGTEDSLVHVSQHDRWQIYYKHVVFKLIKLRYKHR